jgi:hypothetical protein
MLQQDRSTTFNNSSNNKAWQPRESNSSSNQANSSTNNWQRDKRDNVDRSQPASTPPFGQQRPTYEQPQHSWSPQGNRDRNRFEPRERNQQEPALGTKTDRSPYGSTEELTSQLKPKSGSAFIDLGGKIDTLGAKLDSFTDEVKKLVVKVGKQPDTPAPRPSSPRPVTFSTQAPVGQPDISNFLRQLLQEEVKKLTTSSAQGEC